MNYHLPVGRPADRCPALRSGPVGSARDGRRATGRPGCSKGELLSCGEAVPPGLDVLVAVMAAVVAQSVSVA